METASFGDDHDMHVEAVGIEREPDQPEKRLTLEEVYERVEEWDTFYTREPESETVAAVTEHSCVVCGAPILQMQGSVVGDSAIENLPTCRWR